MNSIHANGDFEIIPKTATGPIVPTVGWSMPRMPFLLAVATVMVPAAVVFFIESELRRAEAREESGRRASTRKALRLRHELLWD